jgi:hypothetical protein
MGVIQEAKPYLFGSRRRRSETAQHNGMRLPAGSLHQFLGRDAAGPLEQVQNLLVLLPSRTAFAFLAPLGAFLAGMAFFCAARRTGRLALLRRNVRAPWRDTRLLGGFGLLACGRSRRGGRFFCSHRGHDVFSFGGDYRHDIDHSGGTKTQGKSAIGVRRRWNGDHQLFAGVLR